MNEFREKYTLYPYQRLFETEKLDATEQADEILRHRQLEQQKLDQRIKDYQQRQTSSDQLMSDTSLVDQI